MKPPLKQGMSNDFQTPPEALEPLLTYLKKEWWIWECASGNGNLASALRGIGYKVTESDILLPIEKLPIENSRLQADFIKCEIQPEFIFDCIITNPPFSLKQEFLERCYLLGKPFALLLPLTTFETKKRQELFKKYGLEVIFFDKRINFETPNKVKNSNSWFATAWFTWGLKIGKEMTFEKLPTKF